MNMKSLILIVDDEPINIQILEKALQGSYDICSANNGYDAIRHVKEKHPDLILLDVMMPDLSGFEVCNVIKGDVELADIPIIYLTAMNSFEGEAMGLELGGIDYLLKPVNLALLKLRVRNHIELKARNDLVREQRDLLSRQKKELEAALARIRKLEGIIPICMYCKKIRDDQNSWNQLEQYITNHSEATFSHGICPHCAEEQMKIINTMGRTDV
jgi:response regulator RpfG family c-di-GMP phosphodiesterase